MNINDTKENAGKCGPETEKMSCNLPFSFNRSEKKSENFLVFCVGRRFFQEYGRAFHYFQIVGLKVGQFFTDQDGQWLVRTSVIGLMKDNMLYH